MKLLYITNQICGAAGLERVLSIKTDFLITQYGHEIHIITLNQGTVELFYEFNKDIRHHDIKISGKSVNYISGYVNGLNKVVKNINPDIISVCDDGLKGFFVPLIIKKPCPMVYERHVSKNIEITEDKIPLKTKILTWLKYKLMHTGARFYDKFIVLTKDNVFEWNLNNIEVISNPLSFYPKETALLTNKIVLAVGRQSYQKGYDRLLLSWQAVSKKHPEWNLKIYGKIDKSLKLKELAKNLGINNSVTFLPPTKNIIEVYQEASIYVMSSRFEGFGMVLTEAMSCGVPVISFDCPCGPNDIIANDKDGILVPNNNINLFSNAIVRLIEDEKSRKTMGTKGNQNVTRYLPEHIVPQWNQLFKSLVK